MNYQVENFSYSTKNILLASKTKYLQTLIDKTESLIQQMRWKAFFFLHNHDINNNDKETYRFKSKRPPQHASVLDEFKDNMLNMIQRAEFKTNRAAKDSLQGKLNNDKETYRFKSKCPPQHVSVLDEFEDNMLNP